MNELQAHHGNQPTLSLPPRVRDYLRKGMGHVKYDGQPPRYYLSAHPSGETVPEEVREEARSLLSNLRAMLDPQSEYDARDAREAKLGIVTTLLIGLGGQKSPDPDVVNAKLSLYEFSFENVPAWAVARAAAAWAEGSCPDTVEKTPNYNFPPSPGTLAKMARLEVIPWQTRVAQIENLISCVSFDRALDPARMPEPDVAMIAPGVTMPQLRKM